MILIPQPYSNIVTYTYTATVDTSFRLVKTDLWLREANIHILTNNANYGDNANQYASVSAGDILVFEKFNLGDLYFKNATAGSNTVIYLVGVAMSKQEIKEMLR